MKVLVTKTSDWKFREIREYKDLNECCVSLLSNNDYFFYGDKPQLVVEFADEGETEYEYVVEIYNTWRE